MGYVRGAIDLGDQFEVARRVEHCGAGTLLPAKRLRPDRLRAAPQEAIGCHAGAQQVRDAFQQAGGAQTATSALEGLLPRKSAMNAETLARFSWLLGDGCLPGRQVGLCARKR